MRLLLSILSAVVLTTFHCPIAYCANDPFPIGKLDTNILVDFYPLIEQEVSMEFALQNDGRTLRNTREYGYSFFKMTKGDFSRTPIPPFFQELGELICKQLGHEPVEFTNVILSYYEKGFHLEPHVDVNVIDTYGFNFHFDENVYGIVIEPDPTGHLYFIAWDKSVVPPLDLPPCYSLEEKAGSIFCLQGAFRKSPFYHGVSTVSNRRLSITFRTVQPFR